MNRAGCNFLSLAAVTSLLLTNALGVETGSLHYNTTDPGTTAWNYVGSVNGASGVFLGNFGGSGWVLTAGHVGAGSFTLGNTSYSVGANSFTNFTFNSQLADLTLFQIVGTPSLANLSLAALAAGNSVEMIGNGGGKSWGDNTVYGFTTYTLSGGSTGGPGIVTLASTNGGLGAQGVGGDSGGGMFYQSSGTWYLAGILSAVGPFTDGNGNNLGQGTVAVDLAVYYSQLNADLGSLTAIPEPATFAMFGGVIALSAGLWKRRKPRRD
jgi:hypothetical protein